MKLFYNLLGILAAGVFGYLAEPYLRFQLTGVQPSAAEMARGKHVILQLEGDGKVIDLASLKPEQLPATVLLKSDVKVTDAASGVTLILTAGNRAKLVRLEGGAVVVSPPGDVPYFGSVLANETDLFQQIAALQSNEIARPPEVVPPVTPPVEPAPVIPAPVAPVTPPTGDSVEPTKTIEPPPVPEPAPVPIPAPAPTPEPAPAPAAPTTSASTPADVVSAMQASIKAAQIKEFKFEQVLDWKADANETVDGETYQTGVASYKAETIFGVKTIQAKALLKGGKVIRWIWPKSGMEIK